MKAKIPFIIRAIMVVAGPIFFLACYSGPNYNGPGFYYGSNAEVLGDYDENHEWHDRYWWVSNRHDWVHDHHPDWVADEPKEVHQAYQHQH